jgi:dUTP pyrophosphatase
MPNTHIFSFPTANMEHVIFFRNSLDAVLPTEAAGGCDLYSAEEAVLLSGTWRGIRTDLAVSIPRNHYGRISPRSGPPLHQDICLRDGVIDEYFNEELVISLFNHSDQNYILPKGLKLAKLVLEKIIYPRFIIIDGTVEN